MSQKTNPEKETLNEKANPEQTKRSATGTPMKGGPKSGKKHENDAMKPDEQLDNEAAAEFEKHNMNDNSGYNEAGESRVSIEQRNLTEEAEEAKGNDKQ